MATVVEEILSWMDNNSYGIEDCDGNWARVVHLPNIESMANKWLEMEKQQNIPVREALIEALGMDDEDCADYLKGANNYASVGSKFKVVANTSGHEFNIGEVVTVLSRGWNDSLCCWYWSCKNDSSEEWLLYFEDFELIS